MRRPQHRCIRAAHVEAAEAAPDRRKCKPGVSLGSKALARTVVADLSGSGAMNRTIKDIAGWIAWVLPDTPVFKGRSVTDRDGIPSKGFGGRREQMTDGNFAAVDLRFALGSGSSPISVEEKWCPGAGSNHRHCDFQSHALPTELPGHVAGPETQASGRFIVRSGGPVHPPSPSATARLARLRLFPQITEK
jgi:hypothetical protein